MKPVKVWDPAVRLTHLAMGVLVLGAFLTAEEDDTLPLHMKLGLGLLGIVLFRVVWGFVGSTHARFSDFVKGPKAVLTAVRAMVRGKPAHHLGHNPVGAVMVVTLLVLLGLVTLTGITLGLGPDWSGPLAMSKSTLHAVKEVHEVAAGALPVLIVLHVLGVILSSVQRHFIARASHALRTPLAAVLSQAEVALRKERTAPEYKVMLDDIAASARDSAKLVDGLLSLSRADATTPVERTSVDVNDLLFETKRLFDARARSKSIDLSVSAPDGATVVASRTRLRELLDALLDNALTYTPEGGAVRVEVKGSVLEVRDSGPGIPASEREQVFERFFRGSSAKGTPGSGLGLSVVRAIAEADGATVSIDAAPEGGACVRVRFAN